MTGEKICKYGHISRIGESSGCSNPSCPSDEFWLIPEDDLLWGKAPKKSEHVRGFILVMGENPLHLPENISIRQVKVQFSLQPLGNGILNDNPCTIYRVGFRTESCEFRVKYEKIMRDLRHYFKKGIPPKTGIKKLVLIRFQGKYQQDFGSGTDDPYFDFSCSDYSP